MKPWVYPLLASAALLTISGSPVLAQGQGNENSAFGHLHTEDLDERGLHRGEVIVPDTSVERPEHHGKKAHTNHLIHLRPQAGIGSPSGETPQSIRPLYNLPSAGGSGVIAIVDAYHYPTALSDFNVFAAQFGLPQESSASPTASTNKVFQVVYAKGVQPASDGGWSQEAALDIEWVHAMAPNAKIVLVEAASSSFSDLFAAVRVASGLYGVREVSMSWGGSEFSGETNYDSYFTKTGVVYFASSGDTGGVTIYPGTSRNVVSAGGTTIHRNSDGTPAAETGWSGSGGGRSAYETRPTYQNGIYGIVGSRRGVPDLSFDADPASGVAVYDSTPYGGWSGWFVVGGTSLASPALAGIVNTAATARGSFYTSSAAELTAIYGSLGNKLIFNDIVGGTAGSYTAVSGWDFVTGVGSDWGLAGK